MEKFPSRSDHVESTDHENRDLHEKMGIKKWPEGIERFPKIRILSLDADYKEHFNDENTSKAMLQVAENFDVKRAKEEYDAEKKQREEYDSDYASTRVEEFRDWLLKNGLAREIELDHFEP